MAARFTRGEMGNVPRDESREERIHMEAIVDTYGPEEQAMGWYCYLEDRLQVPFRARAKEETAISPLRKGEEATVVRLAGGDACRCDMVVLIEWHDRTLGVPLAQLTPVDVDATTAEAIADWHYWVGRGHQLC